MILFKDKNINMLQQNVIVLEFEEEKGFAYLAKSTYDQAILLHDRFDGEIGLLKKILNVGDNHKDAVSYFYVTAPEPLNILAPFLGLIKEEVELTNDIELLCGALHQLSMAIDFNIFVKVPEDIRKDVNFSKSVIMKYKQSWKDTEVKIKVAEIDVNTITTDFVSTLLKGLPINSVNVPQDSQRINFGFPYGSNTSVVEEKADEVINVEDPWAMLDSLLVEEDANRAKEEKIDLKEEVEEHPVIKEELKTTKELSTIDKITAMYGGVKK